MARERMVTRTVEEAFVTVMTVNITTTEIGYDVFHISATIPKEKVLRYIEKHMPNPEVKYVTITSYEVTETLYGMSEQDFITFAKVLPPRTKVEEDE
ncbi:MAG: hypothetical protein IKY67_14525 [Paludibacteraceae bacterium]|nr:hypothetical protein [Paludibacteraceae bacterium]